ncbi:Ctse, partial [Symbiodinium sp. CCMP2456]
VPEVPSEDVGAEPTESLEEVAVRLILGQVSRPERKGYVWIENWNKRFQKELGNLRGFIESRPDLFQVKPGNGRSYRVEATEPVSAVEKTGSKNRWRRSRRHN